MFKLGIRVFDDRMKGLPERSSVLFMSSPGIDPAPFGIHTLNCVLKEGQRAIYLVNNKPPASVRREAELLGHDLQKYEAEGRFKLVDSYSSLCGIPCGEKHSVKDPFNTKQMLATLVEAGAEGAVVLVDSMSSFLDMSGDGLDDFLELIQELRSRATVMALFSTWGYEPDRVRRMKQEFDGVFSLRPVEEIVIVRQFLYCEKIGSELFQKMAVPVKVLHPGGVRVYFPKVLITGPFGSGKSTMVRAMSTSAVSVDRMGTTIAMDHGYLDHAGFACDLYGTPGQEHFDPILAYLADEAVAVILVVDATNVKSFVRARTMMQLTKAHQLPLLVAANHQDKAGALPVEAIRKLLSLPESVPIVPTVATDRKGIPELLDALVDKLMGMAQAESREEEGG